MPQRDEDQKELEERIVSNVKELILPYIHQLKKMHLNEAQISNLEIVETHLNDIVTPFLRQIVSHYPHMTAKELQVAVLVKEGKANKLIAELMNVSVNAVEIHRYNLRKKLGLQNKKINLRSYLLSLNKLQ
jgi:DNA-binding CsgD family transcriptional regulator